MDTMKVFSRIIRLLGESKVKYEVIEHEPVLTCEDAAKIRGTSPDQGAKALVCVASYYAKASKGKDKKPVLIVLPCSTRLDFKLFKKWQGVKDLRMATADEVKEITGLEVGSIPPIGTVLDLPTFVDEKLLEQEEICFNAGLHTRSVLMSSEDYVEVVKPEVGRFARQTPS